MGIPTIADIVLFVVSISFLYGLFKLIEWCCVELNALFHMIMRGIETLMQPVFSFMGSILINSLEKTHLIPTREAREEAKRAIQTENTMRRNLNLRDEISSLTDVEDLDVYLEFTKYGYLKLRKRAKKDGNVEMVQKLDAHLRGPISASKR